MESIMINGEEMNIDGIDLDQLIDLDLVTDFNLFD